MNIFFCGPLVSLSSDQILLTEFIQALTHNDFPSLEQMIQKHADILIPLIQEDDFCLPLLTAGAHGNLKLMSYLIEKGANPSSASSHPLADKLPLETQLYLKLVCEFTQALYENLFLN